MDAIFSLNLLFDQLWTALTTICQARGERGSLRVAPGASSFTCPPISKTRPTDGWLILKPYLHFSRCGFCWSRLSVVSCIIRRCLTTTKRRLMTESLSGVYFEESVSVTLLSAAVFSLSSGTSCLYQFAFPGLHGSLEKKEFSVCFSIVLDRECFLYLKRTDMLVCAFKR